MTDITELAQSLKAAADREMICRDVAETSEIWERTVTPENILALVEALEKAQRANAAQDDHINQQQDRIDQLEKGHQEAAKQINSWRRMAKQNIAEREKDIAELDAARQRIAELESHTVKPPVHPTVASENLDDETLQELIEFRRTTFEYHSKEGNKVQTIIHGVTLAALRELQERRKADSEPVAEVVSIYGDPEAFGEREIRPLVGIQQMPYGTKLYRHAQPAPVVSTDLFHTAASAIEDLLTTKDRTGAGVWFDLPFRLRSAANAQPAPGVPEKCPAEIRDLIASHSDELFNDDDAQEIWNGCRAAMLAAAPQEAR
ncbi:hypothetical protein [Klebsiella variicola]|uniref:hypothetical protein n=1 Tax=Klebsiella variicola TaxID=244366 RepID=UPI00065A2CA5|nr:hypothetical protein [Klebsiella variicola]KMI14777.1 hypothetical protein SM85_01991 [Klebsiella variicola]